MFFCKCKEEKRVYFVKSLNKIGGCKVEDKTRSFLLRNIPEDLWRLVKSRAALQGISIRDMLLDAIKRLISDPEK
jgi:hypothetical protein